MIALVLRELESIFGWLLEASWQASVLAALVLVLQWALRGRLNPRWHHALWLLVVARLLLPVLPESSLSLFQFAPAPAPVMTQTMTKPIFPPPSAPMSTQTLAPGSPQVPPALPVSAFTLLALTWLAGALVLLLATWQVNRRFARQVGAAPEIVDPHLLALADDARGELEIRRRLRIIESAQAQGPAIMGLFRPTLILPSNVRARFTDDELRFIFLHEFAHLKRGDLFLQWLIAILQIAHWFNPALWYAFRRMRLDREPATDALVLSRAGEAQKESYGQVLVKLLEHYRQRHSLPTLVGILEDKDQFKQRFLLIARFSRGAYGWSLLGMFVVTVLAVAFLTKAKAGEPSAPSISADTASPGNTGIAAKLGTLHIDLPAFSSASLNDVIARLNKEARRRDPTKQGFCFVVRQNNAKITLAAMKDVSVIDVLRALAEGTRLQYALEQDAIYLRVIDTSDNALVVRTYLVPAGFLNSTSDKTFVDVTAQLLARGIPFTGNSRATYLPGPNKLVIRDTLDALDKLQALITDAAKASGPLPASLWPQPRETPLDVDATVTGLLRIPASAHADFAHSCGQLTWEGKEPREPCPIHFEASGKFVINHVVPGNYVPFVHLAWQRDGVSIATDNEFSPIAVVASKASFMLAWDPEGTSGKGQVEMGLKVVKIDEDTYQAHRRVIDSAIESNDVAGLLTAANNWKGASFVSALAVTTKPDLPATLEAVREFAYPTSFEKPKFTSLPATPTEFATKDIGVSAEVTPTLMSNEDTQGTSILLNGKFTLTEFEGFTSSNLVATGTPTFNTSESHFVEAVPDGGSKLIWIRGAHFREKTNPGSHADDDSSLVRTRLFLVLSAHLIKD